MSDFLHNHSDFSGLLAIVADERGIDPVLVEKDYWIMHCLWGLQMQNCINMTIQLHDTCTVNCIRLEHRVSL